MAADDYKPPPPPGDLAATGCELWEAIMGDLPYEWEFSHRELVWLRMACDHADELATLQDEIEAHGVVTEGSTGQLVVNPALVEARHMRAAIDRYLGRLSLPDETGHGRTSASERGTRAAKARWHRGAA